MKLMIIILEFCNHLFLLLGMKNITILLRSFLRFFLSIQEAKLTKTDQHVIQDLVEFKSNDGFLMMRLPSVTQLS